MKKCLLHIACLLLPLLTFGSGWDTDYKRIEDAVQRPVFPEKTFDINKYGAKPSAKPEKNQKAINKAIEACHKAGGGTVVVPAGVYETGAIRLLSGVNLKVDEGATLLFVFRPELYPIVPTRWEGLDCWNLSPCIYAFQASNVGITGKGTIDGGADNEHWWPWCGKERFGWKEGMPRQQDDNARPRLLRLAEDGVEMDERRFSAAECLRPQLVNFNQCDGVLIEDVTLLRSPFWVIHPLLSKNVTVSGVHINNDGPNGDGCDPESCDGVVIENCFFNTGDDCIAIKSGRNNDGRQWGRPSENIIIRGCRMENGHGGVVIGSEISGGCRNVFAENCTMDSPNLDRVIRIKTNTCRGGVIENIYARNIEVGQCKESVMRINLDYEPREICCRGYLPTVRNVYLDNVTCNKSRYGILLNSLDSVANVYNINVDNCRFEGVAERNKITGKVGDVNFTNTTLNGKPCLSATPYRHLSHWLTRSEMERVPQSWLLDFSKKPKWSYVMGIELEAMLDTYLRYGDESIREYCKSYTDTMIGADGSIRGYNLLDYNLDNVRTGHFVAAMQEHFPEDKNLTAIKTLQTQLDKQPRTKEGVYWHKAIYAYQVWLDGIFMGLPFRVKTAGMLPEKKRLAVYDDAVDQLKKTYERTLDKATGLNRHAWDENRDMFWSNDTTGLSQHCWGRAQGWYVMALVEILDALPDDYARRAEVSDLLTRTLDGVLRWQDKASGVWWQVMDQPGREGNYLESTCSSMMAYSMLKGVRKGYIDGRFLEPARKAYDGIVERFLKVNPDMTVSITDCCAVAGLGPGISPAVQKAAPKVKENRKRDGSFDYYISEPVRDNDAKAVGPFVWASLEMEQAGCATADRLNDILRARECTSRK